MRKLIFSVYALCMTLNLTANEQLCVNIAGIRPLIERNKNAFSRDFGHLLDTRDDYVTAYALQGALPGLTDCILAEITYTQERSEDVLYALANLATIRSASSTVFKAKRSNEQAEVIVQSIDGLFALLPDEVGEMVTRAPFFDFSNKGLREIVVEKLLPNMPDIVDQSCEAESISDVIVIKLSVLDQLDVSLCSKLDHLEQAFDQDGSAIEIEEATVCSLDSQVDVISDDLLSIESNLDFVHTLDSTLDSIDGTLGTIDMTFDAIDENTLSIESSVCVIESKIDVILAENSTESIDSTIDAIEDDACSVDSKVCGIESDLEILNSRLDVIKADVIEIGEGVSIIDTLINP